MKYCSDLPGKGSRILSFIPAINWLSLIYLGGKCSHGISVFCGILYGVITFAAPSVAVVPWVITMIQYAATWSTANRIPPPTPKRKPAATVMPPRHSGFAPQSTTSTQTKHRSAAQPKPTPARTYTDVVVSGRTEHQQTIPVSTSPVYTPYTSLSSSREKFFRDMKAYENKTAPLVPFVPFMSYWPTYDAMNKEQQAWYFYWRSQVRNGQAPNTDLSYIFLHIYELLNGIGWKEPAEGQNRLLWLWSSYQERYPKLTHYLSDWVFDYARQHSIPVLYPANCEIRFFSPSVRADLLIDEHVADIPLKLSFDLIDALCDYSLVDSKFYQDGHQALMREAIPRIVALADAAMVKQTGKGILATYGPTRTRKRPITLYSSAVCPEAGQQVETVVRAYTDKIHLRTYINTLVRYGENALRIQYNCRGRLRGVELDQATAKLIDAFVKKEYGVETVEPVAQVADLSLNRDSIRKLREESDSVREALKVEEIAPSKPLLTDLKEVTAIYTSTDDTGRRLLRRLREADWESAPDMGDEQTVEEINRLSDKYLGCALLFREGGNIVVEDDYRDELEEILLHPPVIEATAKPRFHTNGVTPELKEMLEQLDCEQSETLHVLLTEPHPQTKLATIAEQNMTMPQMLLDSLNEAALGSLGEIIVDAVDDTPYVLDEYAEQLKRAVA